MDLFEPPIEPYVLREYQTKACEDVMAYIGKNLMSKKKGKIKAGIAILPTAAGKSLIIGNVASRLSKVLVLQPSKELLSQNWEKYQSYGQVGSLYSASVGVKELGKITFGTLGSIKTIAEKFKDMGVKVVILDECHYKFPSDETSMFMKFIRELDPHVCVGFTATPIKLFPGSNKKVELKMLNRFDGCFFKHIIHVTQIQDIAPKYWANLEFTRYKYSTADLRLNDSGTEYTDQSVLIANDKNMVNRKIYIDLKRRLIKEKKAILVFVDSVGNAYKFQEAFPRISAVVEGKTKKKERAEIVDRFKRGDLKIIFNQGVFTTGFDHPELDCIVMGRPTKSFALWYQIAGRGTRIHELKEYCEIIDMCNNSARHGDIRNISFDYNEYAGWAMYNNGLCMTGFDINSKLPTREEVILNAKRKKLYAKIMRLNKFDYKVIHFGKYMGTEMITLLRDNRSYLSWMVNDLNKPGSGLLKNAQKIRFYRKAMELLKTG